MGRNSEIKKAIKQEFKPSKPFEEFCRKHNIVFEEEKPRHEEEKPRRKAFSFDWIKAISAFAVCFIAVVIMLVPFNKGGINISPIKYYGDNDVTVIDMTSELDATLDKLIADFGLPLNLESIGQCKRISQVQAKDDKNFVLGYSLEDILYGFDIDNKNNVVNDDKMIFKVNMIIRCYEGYLFTENSFFEELKFDYNEIYQYDIDIKEDFRVAYIKREESNLEYFITLNDYANITEINKTNVELFLDHLI